MPVPTQNPSQFPKHCSVTSKNALVDMLGTRARFPLYGHLTHTGLPLPASHREVRGSERGSSLLVVQGQIKVGWGSRVFNHCGHVERQPADGWALSAIRSSDKGLGTRTTAPTVFTTKRPLAVAAPHSRRHKAGPQAACHP